ncbi:MAG: bis(5'-nucleosyl)-tetraphosphatase (symmetrical) YqeK [Clostridia bacterium]|nr:bis(5'-nucleosyl)-tetraphosphatase (symmetrical) YqeK [Clostridia bacterium]
MLIDEGFINSKLIDEYKKMLASRLSEKRYKHSLCVADEARRLAKLYGADENKAYLAGLLHDITKNSSVEDHLKILDAFGIILSDVEKSSEKLLHAITGSAYVKHYLGVDDEEVIDAIRYHTTARAGMTKLQTVLYLADFTSADRDYNDVDVMRRLVDKSENEALVYALEYTIKELLEKGAAIHPDTVSAYNYIVLKGKGYEI